MHITDLHIRIGVFQQLAQSLSNIRVKQRRPAGAHNTAIPIQAWPCAWQHELACNRPIAVPVPACKSRAAIPAQVTKHCAGVHARQLGAAQECAQGKEAQGERVHRAKGWFVASSGVDQQEQDDLLRCTINALALCALLHAPATAHAHACMRTDAHTRVCPSAVTSAHPLG